MKNTFRPSALTLLVGLLALSSCGQPASTPTQTPTQTPNGSPVAQRSSLGVYELNLTGVGTKQAQATVQSVGQAVGRGLSAQATEITQLTFVPYSTSTVVDSVNHVIHMTASFTVTNNTGAEITVPTYVPVDTDGTYSTDGTTPFRMVRTRTGATITDLNVISAIKPEQSRQTSAGTIQVDPLATPYKTGLDTGALQLVLPAGSTAPGISHSGWQSAALAAGASQVVNFAASVPMQGTEIGDNDPFNFNLVFAVTDKPAPLTLNNIASVQGSTPGTDTASPLSGQSVTVEGVVTAVLPGMSGYFLQEEGIDSDSDTSTSDGIFVYCGSSCSTLSVGQRLRVTGAVSEYTSSTSAGAIKVTELTPSATAQLAIGVPLPPPVDLTLPLDTSKMERYEGMLLRFPETLTVTNNYLYGRYGELDLSNAGRRFIATNGNASATPQGVITLDDGQNATNPGTLPYQSAQNTRRTGDTVTGLTAVWHTAANLNMLEPAGPVNFVDANPRQATPNPVGGTLKIGGANVLNYFTDLDADYSGVNRGANTPAELSRQRSKMATTLTTLDADVLTLMEVENNGDTALQDIVAALNEKAGAGTYAAIPTGKVGTDAIHVAIIYKPAKVAPVGAPLIDNSSIYSRPPVAQTFWDKTTGGEFTVVANHLKSKGCGTGSSAATGANVDSGQGCWNALRVQQANQLLNFVSTIKSVSGDNDVILMGDFNAYGEEDPIHTIVAGGFESLNKRIPAAERYSYQFDGLFGYLDHALASTSLSSQVTGITEWHVNSDEPTNADYNTEFKAIPECVAGVKPDGTNVTCTGVEMFSDTNPFRASDHDPVLVGVNLTQDSATQPVPTAYTTLSANPVNLPNLPADGDTTVSSTLTATSPNYTGPDLTVTTSSVTGLTITAPASVSPNGSFTVSVQAATSVAPGTYPVTVTTTGQGGVTASTTINVKVTTAASSGAVNHLVISQVYGGGGNSGAVYKNDYVELFNPDVVAHGLNGMSLQYASTTGLFGSNSLNLPNVTLQPGQYYLIQLAAGAGTQPALPVTPDLTGAINLSGTGGKVALASDTVAVTGPTAANVVDFLGWGAATTYEGTGAAPATTNATASLRNICTDTNTNSADFTSGTPTPHNTATAPVVCAYPTTP